MPCAPFAGPSSLVAPRICPPAPPMTLAPSCHLTPLLRHRHRQGSHIPAPSLGRGWQQLQEAGLPSISGVTHEPAPCCERSFFTQPQLCALWGALPSGSWDRGPSVNRKEPWREGRERTCAECPEVVLCWVLLLCAAQTGVGERTN